MKILIISDTHSKHHQIPLEWLSNQNGEIETVVHAGDISSMGRLTEIEDFCEWYDSLDFVNKIFICGNHDWGFEKNPDAVAEIISRYPSITYLQDSSIIVGGVKIYGAPWQPAFYNWAFNLQRGEEIAEKWRLIDSDCDILISHGPPSNCDFLDRCMDGQRVGCSDLTKRIIEIKPTLSISGHIHEGYGYTTKEIMSEDGESIEKIVTFVNASVLNHRYEMTNKPIIIELDENKEVKSVVVDYEN